MLQLFKKSYGAEDAVQETFLRLMQSQKPLENDAHLRGWLVVTASNVCKNMLHSWLWQKRQEVEDWEEVLKSDNQTPGKKLRFESPHAAAGKI